MTLQRDFRGFPDHTGNYQGGQQPFELVQAIQPVVSAEDFINQPSFVSNQVTLTAQGQSVVIPIPEREMWRVRFIGGNFLATLSNISVMPIFVDNTGKSWGLMPAREQNLASATTGQLLGNQLGFTGVHIPGDGILLFSGYQVGWNLTQLSGGNCDAEVTIQRQVIKI